MKLKYITLLCLPLIFAGCLDESNTSVVLPSGSVSRNVIPSELRDIITEYIPVYEGSDIPVISGYFIADNVQSVYCSDEDDGGFAPGHKFADHYMYFGSQNALGQIDEYQGKQSKSYDYSSNVQVMGSGNRFTAYFITESWADYNDDGYNETYTKMSTIISGRIEDDGIYDYELAIIMLDKKDPLDKIMKINTYRIFEEADGLAERTYNWRAPKHDCTADMISLPTSVSINNSNK